MKDIKTLIMMIHHLRVILDKKQRIKMFGVMVVILVGALFEMLGVSAMLPFIQALLAPDELINKPYIIFFTNLFGISGKESVLTMVGIGIVLIYLIKNAYLSLSSFLQVRYSTNTKRELAVLMMRSFVNRPYSFFVENGSGVIFRGVIDDINGLHQVIFNILKMATEGFVVIAVAAYLASVDFFLATGVLVTGVTCMIIVVFGVKKMLKKMALVSREAYANMSKQTSQINNGIKEIMVFDKRKMFIDSYDKSYKQYNEADARYTFSSQLPERVIEACCISGIIIMVLVRLNIGTDPTEFVPKMAVFAMGAFRLLPSISRITGYISTLIYNRPKVEGVYDNIVAARQNNSNHEMTNTNDDLNSDLSFKSELEVKDLDWQYPHGKARVLDGLSFTVKKGEAIGIVGESGSGKSTLADIMLGLYKPEKGKILMDGIDISTIPGSWARIIAYVPQSVFLMDDTIRANVAFGSDVISDDSIWEVLDRVSLGRFVRDLPDGLDTIVGERGIKFSGGQRQRLAIARAVYIKPQIMILDEATSALDNETEEAVMEAIDSLAGSMTLIIIAHRITTLRNCNRIFEIANGKAVEKSINILLGDGVAPRE